MIDIFKVASECLYRFSLKKGGLRTMCLSQPTAPAAVYALCCKVSPNIKTLMKFVDDIPLEFSTDADRYLACVLVYEICTSKQFPDKRRKASKETRNMIAKLKTATALDKITELQMAEPLQEQ